MWRSRCVQEPPQVLHSTRRVQKHEWVAVTSGQLQAVYHRRWLALVAIASLAAFLWGCERHDPLSLVLCANDVQARTGNGANQLIAVVGYRNCGATTGYVTIVWLASARDLQATSMDNTLVALNGEHRVPVGWSGDAHTLTVHLPPLADDDVFIKKKAWRGVAVEYVRDH